MEDAWVRWWSRRSRVRGLSGRRGKRWIASAALGRERHREWAALLQETASNELEELGKLCWSTTGLEEPPTTSTMRAQLTVTSDLDKVSDILEADTTTAGLLERRLVWSEGPWRADNMLRVWEGVLDLVRLSQEEISATPDDLPGEMGCI